MRDKDTSALREIFQYSSSLWPSFIPNQIWWLIALDNSWCPWIDKKGDINSLGQKSTNKCLQKQFLIIRLWLWHKGKSSNFLGTFFRPQPTIWTKKTGNSTTSTAKTTPLFYKRRNKIVRSCSMNWSIKRWILENGLAVILTPKLTS